MHRSNKMKRQGVVVYPGTFDPITNGHIDIIKRARNLFPVVKVLVAENLDKKPLFSYEERLYFVKNAISDILGVECEGFSGLLIDYLREHGINIVVRGLRAVSDFDYEFQMTLLNRKLYPSVEYLFLMPGEEYFFLSSYLVKEIASFGGKIGCFVPKIVEEKMRGKFLCRGRACPCPTE